MKDLQNDPAALSEELAGFIHSCGAAISGYCDLSAIENLPFPDLTTGIAMGISLNPEIVLMLKEGPNEEYSREYSRVNSRLAELSENVAGFLRDKGYRAEFIPPTRNVDSPDYLSAEFSHKTAATSAGLGWIGKNALFITKEFGPAVRIVTVFTDAPLATAEPAAKSYCGTCDRCRELCPAGAIFGTNWSRGMSREELMDAIKCFNYARRMGKETGSKHAICGTCISACPWTDKYLKREGLL